MNWREQITVTPDVCHGTPCFKGTRVTVAVVLENLAAGRTAKEIFADYPTLRPETLPAAMAYAAELARELVVDLPRSDAA